MKFRAKISGFTLIELLVTISIIGVLSSVILMSLSNSRVKADETVIIQNLIQFRNLYELEYSNNGSYAGLQPEGPYVTPCAYFQTNPNNDGYRCTAASEEQCLQIYGESGIIDNSQAYLLCLQIVDMTGNFGIGLAASSDQKYSLWAWLPYREKYMCLGSSKTQTMTQNPGSPTSQSNMNLEGCPGNP